MSDVRRVTTRDIVLSVLTGLVANSIAGGRDLRKGIARELWGVAKRYGSRRIRQLDLLQIDGMRDLCVEGFTYSPNAMVVSAFCRLLDAKTVFEIGTYLGRTTWTIAHNTPDLHIYTLDLPEMKSDEHVRLELTDDHLAKYHTLRDERERVDLVFEGTEEQRRITQLFGDSASFDFSEYYGRMDVVYVDGSHSYSYVRNDTEAALKMLTNRGMLIWDDYTHPGVYKYLNDLSKELPKPIWQVSGSRALVYSRQGLPITTPPDGAAEVS